MTQSAERQRHLPLRKAAQIAWKGIRIRLGRSVLVTAGIVLPIAFLMYIMCSNALSTGVMARGGEALALKMKAQEQLAEMSQADMAIQTRWMIGLALLISFVGILNAMLMSVTERFREIGTMKCLGALDGFIVKLFLLESVFQGVVGTVTGVVIGLLLAFAEGIRSYGGAVWALLPPGELGRYAMFAFAAGVILAVSGAIYPALRAARMKPVDAMRTEV
ncbi:ABC transporter permease [Verrucomicrobiota bacterium]